ncbi:hypothetical protein [Burkholderia sp. LMU1-1-1.1]|uniref:hypothetical protein n=1 Tax=Burkholderia sp. LMU1-1-1.1 TaxID=3135266 RepID=UPI003420D76D
MTTTSHATESDFFTDVPLRYPADGMGALSPESIAIRARWVGHVIVERKGHAVWCARADVRPSDGRCFYDGDYSDVLEADDPRVSD